MSDLDPALEVEISAVIKMLATEAIRDALTEIACATSLAPDEEQLLTMYRASAEQHRTAAIRTLERGLPAEKP